MALEGMMAKDMRESLKRTPEKCCHCGKTGHKARDCWSNLKNRLRSQEKTTTTCFEYGETGHFRSNCPEKCNSKDKQKPTTGRISLKDDKMNYYK